MRKDYTIKRKESFLIADSAKYGKDQCISKPLRYNPEHEEANEKRIKDAINYAQMYGYTNIRIVTGHYIALTIKSGVIAWIKTKESINRFTY